MVSLTQWTTVWVNSWSWWWTGRPDVLWFMGLQKVRHDWATELILFRIDRDNGASFHFSGPSRISGDHKGSSWKLWVFPPMTWHNPISACVVNVQPCAGDKGTEVSKTLTFCLSEAIRLWGETDMQSYYFSPVSWALWWCGYTHATSVWCWRLKEKVHIPLVWNNKIQKPNVRCGVPWWFSGKIIPC